MSRHALASRRVNSAFFSLQHWAGPMKIYPMSWAFHSRQSRKLGIPSTIASQRATRTLYLGLRMERTARQSAGKRRSNAYLLICTIILKNSAPRLTCDLLVSCVADSARLLHHFLVRG